MMRFLFSVFAHIGLALLILGGICVALMFAVGSALAAHLLLPGRQALKGWRERRHYHLSMAEWDSRKQIGMPLDHTERLAYELADPEWWNELEERIWPESGWVDEIEAHWRERGWKQ